jgi:hypothetical protein
MTSSICQESSAAELGAAVRGELLHHAALCHTTADEVNTLRCDLFGDQCRSRVLLIIVAGAAKLRSLGASGGDFSEISDRFFMLELLN